MPNLKKNPDNTQSPQRITRSQEQLAKDFAAVGKDAEVRKNKRTSSKEDQVRNVSLIILSRINIFTSIS